ncbi:hypothetical protein C4K03_1228 [Pseudomonas synxantha]|uniref:Dermonecrotic toxin N-terminal domain-containing protein n=1 Tax=Pseudomonas synxantha TaxID=47883 RepID=A0A3G7U496_9PSED|nr:DUF6543 domain-containing protein [Pseudomonas synxantha]AZE53399.1 hypothetical protein C4K03_1228 [Pseudomonas synxantha]
MTLPITLVPQRLQPQANIDDDLLWDATQRWQDCHRGMLALMAGLPTIRDSINRLLQEDLQLDGERVGLEFFATEQRSSRRITLTEACLYMQQHPTLDTTQIPAGKVLHMPHKHSLANYPVALLLDELKTLDLEQAIDDNWLRYWRTQRAPSAPVTCLNRVIEFYKIHFEASAEHLLAEGKVNAEALAPLFSLINPAPATSAGQRIYTEQVLLKTSHATTLPLPGAWVVTLDTEPPTLQLLYVPSLAPAWHTFTRRTDMERWLLDRQQTLFASTAIDPSASIEYKIRNHPLDEGIGLWLKQLTQAQYQDAISAVPNVSLDEAYQARLTIDQLDAQRQGQSLFAAAPSLPEAALIDPQLPQFGQLNNAVNAWARQALVRQQRHALEQLLAGDEPSGPAGSHWQSLQLQLDALKVQQQAAQKSAHALLNRRPLDIAALNTHYSALYQARLQGLRIEAQIQRALNQLSDDELLVIETALATPLPDVVALTLSVTPPGNTTPTRSELKGPLVFLPPQDPQTPTTRDGSHILYWPGSDGALQRFASRQALEEGVFAILPADKVLALQFTALERDPFDYSLSCQQTAFEEQAARVRQTWSAPEQTATLAVELEKLREQTLPSLLIPANTAREAAFLQLVEDHNSDVLTQQLPSWLRTQSAENQEALKALLNAYIPALKSSQALQDRSLSARDVFVSQQIEARLRKDFALGKGFTLALDLPDTVEQKRDIIPGAAPGTPVKVVSVPSVKRSNMDLDELALRNIDDDLSRRLAFMKLEVTADDPSELATLKAGVTSDYLRSMVPDLNLAKQYEDLILATFRGVRGESMHQKQYRRECLIEPLRLMLKAQGMLARMQNHISVGELSLLNIAIDADTHDAWKVDGKHIRLLPAHLTVGGKDTNEETPITLSGITFIEEKSSGSTLLYLPDAPDERCLRGFTNLNQARIALFELCRLDSMVEYVAGRAIKGDVRAHIVRIDQATHKGYDALIQAGVPWPPTTSLATHQLNAHMGRLIEANRNDARSNDDLAQEKYALKSGELLNGIKIALGFVPFIGTAVTLADAGISLFEAVTAFRSGKTGQGIEQLASVFECLVFAALDSVSIAAAPAARGNVARQLTRSRQVKSGARPGFWRSVKSRQGTTPRQRFAGYEHSGPLDAGTLQAVSVGPYRHTLRHTAGDHFILSEGRYFKVKFDPTSHEMRLVAPGKYYAPAIALDQAQQWDTYSALNGGRLTGYGGGSRRTRGGRANVPPAVERQLPAAALEVNMQRLELGKSTVKQLQEFHSQVLNSNVKVEKYLRDHPDPNRVSAQKNTDSKALDIELLKDLEGAKKTHALLENAKQNQLRVPGVDIPEELNRTAHIISDRLNRLLEISTSRSHGLNERILAITDELNNSSLRPDRRLVLINERRQCRLEVLTEFNRIETSMKEMGTWVKRITHRSTRTQAATLLDNWKKKFTALRIASMRSGNLMQALTRLPQTISIDWIYLENAVQQLRTQFDRTVTTHMNLPEANISRVERNRILESCIKVYEELSRNLIAWNNRSPDHFDTTFLPLLQDNLKRLIQKARNAIKKPASEPKPSAAQAAFETEDGQLLIGTEKPAGQLSPRQFIINDADGAVVEVWDNVSDSNTFRLNTTQSRPVAGSRSLPTDVNAVVAEARTRLGAVEAFENKVRSYKTMEPVNLEHILHSEANALETRASHIQSLDAGNPLVEQLRSRATALKQSGEALRIQRSLESKTPTEGYLDYLMEKRRVVIRKQGTRQKLRGKRPDGQDDYLQEYEVYDASRQGKADKPIWYAHFHYETQHSAFDSFPKAHLKLADQRYLGMKWQAAKTGAGATFADTTIWRGDIGPSFAKTHFQPLG